MDSSAKIAVKTAELVDASRFGDRMAFDALVDRFRPLATRYAYSLLQDQGLAEDACQEAFVDAFLHLGQLRESAAFSGWLRRIVLKHADRQRRSRLLFVELSELPGARDPLALLIEAEAAREIHAEIADLPSRLRTAVSMFYRDGYSVIEIAAFLEIPQGAVKKRLFDARRRLRASLSPSESEELKP